MTKLCKLLGLCKQEPELASFHVEVTKTEDGNGNITLTAKEGVFFQGKKSTLELSGKLNRINRLTIREAEQEETQNEQ